MTREERLYTERLEKIQDELKWLYMELYDDEQAYEYFGSMLHRMYEARKPALKKQDESRLADPAWFRRRDILGMQMYPGCYARTLKGVSRHLDYLQESGVNYLHLMPLLQSPHQHSDGGYAVADFRTVDPELGTMEDLERLAGQCRRRNILLCLDFVMNHTSDEHEWAKRARAGEKEYQNRYFFYDNWDIPLLYEQTVPEVFPQTAPGNFSLCTEVGKVVMTTFHPYQWDLNYHNPTVFNDMTENLLFLCNQGVDVIRLDAVPYIWKMLGTNCRNLPQVHTLVRMMHLACDLVCPGTLLLGEVVMEPSKVVPYFGTTEKPECQMLYNVTTMASTWHTVATRDVRLLRHQLRSVFQLPGQYLFLNYLRCHDDIGWGLDYDFLRRFGMEEISHKQFLNDYFTGAFPGSLARGELYNNDPKLHDARMCGTTASLCGVEGAEQKGDAAAWDLALRLDETLHAFLLSQSGIPIIYSGDEIGQLNDWGYRDDPDKAEDSRFLHRGSFRWEDAKKRSDPATRQGRLYAKLRQLETLRAEHPAFSAEADCWLLEPQNDHILAIGRYYRGEKLLALYNFDPEEQTALLCNPEAFRDLLSGEACSAQSVTLPGYGFKWLHVAYEK